MKFDWDFFWQSLLSPSDAFIAGLWMTINVSVVSMVLALVLGLVIALMRLSRFAPARSFAVFYIWIIRGTPLLVLLVIIYLGLAAAGIYRFEDATLLGITLRGAIQAAIIGLMINESAYISEIIRAAIQAVDKGQMEAALTLGMHPTSAMRWIVLAQALRTMVPPLGNIFNSLMKNTSLLSIIGVSEMFLITQAISSATFRTFEIFIVVALYYLLLTTVWTVIQDRIEAALDRQIGIRTPNALLATWNSVTTSRPWATRKV